MKVFVCGLGIISSIGNTYEENFQSLKDKKCGIEKSSFKDSILSYPFAKLKLSDKQLKELLGLDEATVISRTALMSLYAAKEALEDASLPENSRIAFVNATSVGGMDLTEDFYVDYLKDKNKADFQSLRWHKSSSSTDFVAEKLGLNSYRATISTACSSSANAMISAVTLLELGICDYVIAGGVDSLSKFTINGFNSLKILDENLCKPLDRDRNGLNLGEGAAYIVLTLNKDTPKTYCALAGYANANDCFHQTASSKEGRGASLAMQYAMESANISPSEIDYINLHGTGTQNNDASELAAISKIFKTIPPCSSTKSYTGHTLAASGAIEAVYSIMALKEKTLFASLRFENPIEEFAINAIRDTKKVDSINYVLSNSFGFGGNCSSLIFSNI